MEKVYYSLVLLALTALVFPLMQSAVNDANLSNAPLDTFLTSFPLIILIVLAIIPITLYAGKKR